MARAREVPGLHARIFAKGGDGLTDGVAKGDWTGNVRGDWADGYFKEIVRPTLRECRDWRWRCTYSAEPGKAPTYALRTADGGAIVWYELFDEMTHRNPDGAPAVLLKGPLRLLSGKRISRTAYSYASVYQFATRIYPNGKKSKIIAAKGAWDKVKAK